MSEVTGPDLIAWLHNEVEEIMDGVEKAVEATVEELQYEIEYVIDNSGTGKTWVMDWSSMPHAYPGRTGSYPGRVASGKMGNAIDSRTTRSKRKVKGEVGWINEYEPYFGFQETGGKHNLIPGLQIEGMYAIHDAAARADYLLEKNIDKELK